MTPSGLLGTWGASHYEEWSRTHAYGYPCF